MPMRTFSRDRGAGGLARRRRPPASRTARRSPCSARTASGSTAWVPLAGDFNVANALAAIAALAEAGLRRSRRSPPAWPPAAACPAGSSGSTPARTSSWSSTTPTSPTPSRPRSTTLRPLTDGRLIVVLGAGGDRDPGKRPLMGEIAARLADVLVVTDDNPRTEDPAAIRAAVLAGTAGGAAPRCSRSATGGPRSARALAPGRPRRHRAGRGQGPRDRPGDRRRGAPVRRPRRGARGAGGLAMIPLTTRRDRRRSSAGVVARRRRTVTGPAFVDSRAVEPGGLFVAVAGEHVDGHDVRRGCGRRRRRRGARLPADRRARPWSSPTRSSRSGCWPGTSSTGCPT